MNNSSLCELNGPLTNMQRAKKMRITDLNPYLTCRLCNGYLVDATTIVECLHSFCKTCIVKFLQEKEEHKYCPTCEVQMHKTKPLLSIRSDKTLQDIVYKLVPGLFKAEMKRRRDFYAEHPDSAVSQLSTPEDRGLVHEEHFIYTPDEDISLSLEHWLGNGKQVANNGFSTESAKNQDATGSSKVEDMPHRRYLRCTAAVTVAHLKKLIRLKYELSSFYKVDIIHQNDVLCEDYTLVDVAYIYSWRRNGPMRFFYRIEERYRVSQPKRLKLSNDLNQTVSGQEVVLDDCTKETAVTAVSVPVQLDSDRPQPPSKVASSLCAVANSVNETPARNVVVSVKDAPPILAKDPVVCLAKIPSAPPVSVATKSRLVPKVAKVTAAVKTKGGREKRTPGPKKVVVNLKSPPNPANVIKRLPNSCNGDKPQQEVKSSMDDRSANRMANLSKENGESEQQMAATTLVSIGTKETKNPEVLTKDSMVVVVVASNEPPETPMSNATGSGHLHLVVSPSPPPQLQLPVPDISITPIPPSPQRSQLGEAPLKLSLPREALLATNPQVEIIKKVSPVAVTATATADTTVASTAITTTAPSGNDGASEAATITSLVTISLPSPTIVTSAAATTTTTIVASNTTATEEILPTVAAVQELPTGNEHNTVIPAATTTEENASTEAPEVPAITSSAATTASTTVITTSSSDSTTTTITITSTPTPEVVSESGSTNPVPKDFSDEAPPKHDNIGALDLSKNSRAIGLPRRSLTPSSTPPPRSPTSRSSPPTFHAPPSLSRVPAQAHVHGPLTPKAAAAAAAAAVAATVTVPQPPLSTFHPPISRSVPASLSSAAARPLFMSGRAATRPHVPITPPLQGNSFKLGNSGPSINGIANPRTYSNHRHGHHHHHGSGGGGGGVAVGKSDAAGHGHSSRAVPKHILSAIGMLAVKKPDYMNRMGAQEKSNAVSAKPAVLSAGLGNFRNGSTKVDTSSSSV